MSGLESRLVLIQLADNIERQKDARQRKDLSSSRKGDKRLFVLLHLVCLCLLRDGMPGRQEALVKKSFFPAVVSSLLQKASSKQPSRLWPSTLA